MPNMDSEQYNPAWPEWFTGLLDKSNGHIRRKLLDVIKAQPLVTLEKQDCVIRDVLAARGDSSLQEIGLEEYLLKVLGQRVAVHIGT